MKRSELEKDVAFILDRFKNIDYEIPSNRDILKVIFSKLVIVYALQVVFIVIDVFLNSKSGDYHYFDTIVLALGSNAFFSVMFLMSTYNSVCMRLALGDEIIKQSVFLKLIAKKISFYSLFILLSEYDCRMYFTLVRGALCRWVRILMVCLFHGLSHAFTGIIIPIYDPSGSQ